MDDHCSLSRQHSDSPIQYKVASITCLFIAQKVYNGSSLFSKTLSDLSDGEVSSADIIQMESMIINVLSFELCPTIACSYVRSFYALLPQSAQNAAGQDLIHIATFLTELSVMDISFKNLEQSSIAFAAILNALDSMDQNLFLTREKEDFLRKIECSLGFSESEKTILRLRRKLAVLSNRCHFFPKDNANAMKRSEIDYLRAARRIPVDARDDCDTVRSTS